jgi:hypothetical protein
MRLAGTQVVDDRVACLGQGRTAARAQEQLDAQLLLEPVDRLGQGRLRQPESFGRLKFDTKALFF